MPAMTPRAAAYGIHGDSANRGRPVVPPSSDYAVGMVSPKSALVIRRIDAILARLAAGEGVRFTVLRQVLMPITARTLQMLLGRLVQVGWVERDPRTRLYHLGAGMIALAQRVVAGSSQERVAALVTALAVATGCSAAWFVLRDDGRSVLSAKHEVAGGHLYTPVGGLKDDFVRHGFGQVVLAVLPATQRRRLLARPGLTGLAQVSGRASIPWSERIEIDVRYVEAQGDYARLHTATGSHLVRVPLAVLEERWQSAGFVRVHRSYLVSTGSITELRVEPGGGHSVRVGSGTGAVRLPVSRRHSRDLKDRLVRRARREADG